MTIIERSIVIPAPAATVWATLTDTARYGSWNSFMPELAESEAAVRLGSVLSVAAPAVAAPSKH